MRTGKSESSERAYLSRERESVSRYIYMYLDTYVYVSREREGEPVYTQRVRKSNLLVLTIIPQHST